MTGENYSYMEQGYKMWNKTCCMMCSFILFSESECTGIMPSLSKYWTVQTHLLVFGCQFRYPAILVIKHINYSRDCTWVLLKTQLI